MNNNRTLSHDDDETSIGTGFVYTYSYNFIQYCPAVIPQFSRKFLINCVQSRENPRKSAVFRYEPGRYGTPSHLFEIKSGSLKMETK